MEAAACLTRLELILTKRPGCLSAWSSVRTEAGKGTQRVQYRSGHVLQQQVLM